MWIFDPSPTPSAGRMLGIFRIVAALVFVSVGTMKLFDYPASPMPGMSPVDPLSQMGIGGMIEVIGGLAIAVGLFTRPVAFVLAGEMAVAYFQFHAPASFWPTTNQGMPAIMYCFFFLYLVFAGAGAWSVDGVLHRRRLANELDQATTEPVEVEPEASERPPQKTRRHAGWRGTKRRVP